MRRYGDEHCVQIYVFVVRLYVHFVQDYEQFIQVCEEEDILGYVDAGQVFRHLPFGVRYRPIVQLIQYVEL